jgi:predicted nucleotidyltransferase
MKELPDEIKKKIISVLTGHGAVKISIFGSFARGEERPESDIDIIVRFEHPKSLLQLIRIEEEVKLCSKPEHRPSHRKFNQPLPGRYYPS